MPKYRLSKLELDEISLVFSGDDGNAKVLIAKADPELEEISKPGRGYGPNPKSSAKEIAGSHGHRSHGKSILWPALYEHLRAKGYTKEKAARISNAAWHKKKKGIPLNTPTSVRGVAKETPQQEYERILKELADIDKSGTEPDDPDTLSDQVDQEDQNMPPEAEDQGTPPEINKDDLPDEVVEYIEALESELTDLLARSGSDDDDKTLHEALAKSDPVVRAMIEKQEARIKQAEEIAKSEREARLTREYISKAEAMPMISENPSELGALLRVLAEKAPEETAKIEELLKAANAQISKGNLFLEFGTGGAETTISKSVESLALELMKTDPNLTKEMAISKVYELNPKLYAEAVEEG